MTMEIISHRRTSTYIGWTGPVNLESVYNGLDVNGNFDTVNVNDSNLSTITLSTSSVQK